MTELFVWDKIIAGLVVGFISGAGLVLFFFRALIREYIKHRFNLYFKEKNRILEQDRNLAKEFKNAIASSRIIDFITKNPDNFYPEFKTSSINMLNSLLTEWNKKLDVYFQDKRLDNTKNKLLSHLETYFYCITNQIGIEKISSNEEKARLKLSVEQLKQGKHGKELTSYATKAIYEYKKFIKLAKI